MKDQNLLRMAVETRKEHLIKQITRFSAGYATTDELQQMALSDLEEEWKRLQRKGKDGIG